MSKRNNITYVKPQDPSFLKRLKEQIGFKEGPTVETKRQKLENESSGSEGEEDRADEKPQVVVLKQGDLTSEQAEQERHRIEKEEKEKPADLSQRVIFKAKVKAVDETTVETKSEKDKKEKKSKSSKSKKAHTSKLSFNDQDDEDEEN